MCNISIGVVGDVCRALETKILPFCDDIVQVRTHAQARTDRRARFQQWRNAHFAVACLQILLEDLQNPYLHREVWAAHATAASVHRQHTTPAARAQWSTARA